jgi:hypothetical protein
MSLNQWLKEVEMKSWFMLIGIVVLVLFSYIKLEVSELIKILAPIFIASSVVLLGVFALDNIRKSIWEHYSKKRNEIIRQIEIMRKNQAVEDLKQQIVSDRNISYLRESLEGFQNNRFERCLIFSIVLFGISFIATFIDITLYVNIPNLVLQVVSFMWGLYYFSQMLSAIFVSFKH